MADNSTPNEAFVWVWLPGAVEPVVAGVLSAASDTVSFTYGLSYLERSDAIPLYLPELPLRRGTIPPPVGLALAGCIQDAGPDAWGQRVVLDLVLGRAGGATDPGELSLLSYLLESGSDRAGALDFQSGADRYLARSAVATLQQMQEAADRLQAGERLEPALALALLHGSSLGGARPKVVIRDVAPGKPPAEMIAKLSVATDQFPVVKAEAVAMELARRVGLDVAATRLVRSLDRDVLLVDRFDRPGCRGSATGLPGERRMVVSALTVLGLDELSSRYATYPDLADAIRARFTNPDATLRELFTRIVFNVCVSNTDDHARNHAAFWDGEYLTLTPAYDISPQLRGGDTAAQAMAIGRDGSRSSRLAVCLAASEVYHLTHSQAQEVVDSVVETIDEQWDEAAQMAELTVADRTLLWRRLILNRAIHYLD